jgi:hypothetical protein
MVFRRLRVFALPAVLAVTSPACGRVVKTGVDAGGLDAGSDSAAPAVDLAVEVALDAKEGDGPPEDGADALDPESSHDADGPSVDALDAAPGQLACVDAGCPWTPRRLEGLALWLDASVDVVVDGSLRVMRWHDQSGHDNHAFQNFDYQRPLLNRSQAERRPRVEFGVAGQVGVFLRINDAPNLQWGSGDFTVAIVGSTTNSEAEPGAFLRKQVLFTPIVGLLITANVDGAGSLSAQVRYPFDRIRTNRGLFNTGQTFLYTVRRQNVTMLELRADGDTTWGGVPDIDLSTPGRDVFVGAHGDELSTLQLRGSIAELIAVRGGMTPVEIQELESYLVSKHKLRPHAQAP